MKTLIVTSSIIFSAFGAFSQQYNIEWLNPVGANDYDLAKEIELTSTGDVISYGYFSGTVDFDPTSGISELTADNSLNSPDLFIQKTSATGTVLWTKQFIGSEYEYVRAITVDDFDNIYLTLTHTGPVDVDPGPATNSVNSAQNYNMTLVKLTTNGDFIWANTYECTYSMWVEEMIVDNADEILMTGWFAGAVDFNPTGNSALIDLGTTANIFVLKIDLDGDFIWVKTFGNEALDHSNDLTVDAANNIYLTGKIDATNSFPTTVEFAPGMSISCSNEIKGFTLKMTPTGDPIWLIESGNEGHGIEIGEDGNCLVIGAYEGTFDFDPSGNSFTLTSATPATFIQKLTPNGTLIWAKSYPVLCDVIELDYKDNIYISGQYTGIADFTTPSLNMQSEGLFDICILGLNSNGNTIWTRSMGSVDEDRAYDLKLGTDNRLYAAGSFSQLCDFGIGGGIIPSAGSVDAFLLKLNTSLSLNEQEQTISHVGISPNPSTGLFHITQASNQPWDVLVRDAHGKVLLEKTVEGESFSLDLTGLASGVYFLSGSSESEMFVERVVLE
jgi:hypothetical protein